MTDTSPIIVGLQSPGPTKWQIHGHISSNMQIFQSFLSNNIRKRVINPIVLTKN